MLFRSDLQYLRVWISRLRSKLQGDGSQAVIRTFRGVGYMFDPVGAQRPAQPAVGGAREQA